MDKSKSIAIIGGGIGGLTCALALIQKGFNVTIFEQADEIKEVGAGISLWHNAMFIFKQLGISELITRSGEVFKSGAIFNSQGKTLSNVNLQELSTKYEVNAVAIHRAELIEILRSSVGSENIFLSHEFYNFEYIDNDRIQLEFKNGVKLDFDIVIAADGINSRMRDLIMGSTSETSEKKYSGYPAYRGVLELDHNNFERIKSAKGEYWGFGKRIGYVPISNSEIYWFATLMENEDKSVKHENFKQYLLDQFQNWDENVIFLLKNTPSENIIRNNIYDLNPTSKWFAKNIVLIGDAIHATTPNLGQGAGMAIEDAFALSNLFVDNPVEEAFSKFFRLRFARTSHIILLSRRIGNVAMIENRIICTIRNILMKLLSFVMEKQAKNTVKWEYLFNY